MSEFQKVAKLVETGETKMATNVATDKAPVKTWSEGYEAGQRHAREDQLTEAHRAYLELRSELECWITSADFHKGPVEPKDLAEILSHHPIIPTPTDAYHWRPIEDAPRDGTWIMARGLGWVAVIVQWCDDDGWCGGCSGGWDDEDLTHFMLIPPLPESEGK